MCACLTDSHPVGGVPTKLLHAMCGSKSWTRIETFPTALGGSHRTRKCAASHFCDEMRAERVIFF
jgi:hypothetical protein